MKTLGVILARAGSKGLPGKNSADLFGVPMITYTIEHALSSRRLDHLVVSTDGAEIAAAARAMGVPVIDRPAELASDTAPVDAAARHAVEVCEKEEGEPYQAVVILYGNVPLRPTDLTDRAIEKLERTGCDSVQSVFPVGKMHPYWMKKLEGPDGDRIEPFVKNTVYRRQDLPPLYQLDGGLIAVRRDKLFKVDPKQPHAFLGTDRRAIVTEPGQVVDVDNEQDLTVAKAMIDAGTTGVPEHAWPLMARDVPHPSLIIGRHRIREGEKTYIIAELGVNHDGSLEKALELTRLAKKVGADAIKLQLFDPKCLLSQEAELAEYQTGSAQSPDELLARLQLPLEDKMRVRDLAHELGLDFVVTCFSLELVESMRRLDVDAVKVASPDCVNLPLIEKLVELDKPMLVSVGTARQEEMPILDEMAKICRSRVPLGILQCVSCYPVPPGESGVHWIHWLSKWFGVPVGYSDHTCDLHTGMLAVAAGACVIEKHLTYDMKALGPDHAASFDGPQFARYVELIRLAEREIHGLGSTHEDIEENVRRVSRQSVCAVKDLKRGTVLRPEHLTIKRPGTGLPAHRLREVLGKKLKRGVQADTLLRAEDVDWG